MRSLTDTELLRRLHALLRQSRRVEADLVAHIGEVDARRLCAREAFPSMFAYATQALHLTEGEAYARIAVARAARQHPMLLTLLRDGRLHLTGIVKLLPHLTQANRASLLASAEHKTKRQIEELIAELTPRPDVPATMRKLPEPRTRRGPQPSPRTAQRAEYSALTIKTTGQPCGSLLGAKPSKGAVEPRRGLDPPSAASAPPSITSPLAPARYKVPFTASAKLHAKLERLQALKRSRLPDGDIAAIIEYAVTEQLERLEARRFALTRKPRKDIARLPRFV